MGAFLAPAAQPVSVPAILVEVAFRQPFLAPAAALLFYAANGSMALLELEVSSFDLAGPQVILMLIFTLTRFAPVPQTVFEGAAYAELSLVLHLFAHVTFLHFHFTPSQYVSDTP